MVTDIAAKLEEIHNHAVAGVYLNSRYDLNGSINSC